MARVPTSLLRSGALLALLLVSGASLFPCAAQAGNWNLKTTLTETGSYQTNPMMRIGGGEAVYGSATTPEVTVENVMPRSSLAVKASVTQNIFSDAAFNSTDFHTLVRGKRNNQRWAAMLDLTGDYDTTRTSELTTFGTQTKSVRHWGYGLAPQLSFSPNTENSFTLNAGASTSRYETSSYTDYELLSAGLSWAHVFTPFSTGNLALNARRYQTRNKFDETVDSVGPGLAWQMKLSETLSTLVGVGAEATRQERAGLTQSSGWTWGATFSGGLTYKGEQDTITVKASRAQQPYSNGSSSLLTTFAATEKHRFNSLFTGDVDATYQRAKKSALSSSNLKDKITAGAGVSYNITPTLDARAGYRYRRETLTNRSDVQTDNAGTLSIVYRPDF